MRPGPDARALWALLFVAGRAVPRARLAAALGTPEETVDELAKGLGEHLEAVGAPLAVARAGSGYQLVLDGAYHDLARLLVGEAPARLSPAVLETLAVVAYRQPAARAAVEAMRGVRAERSLALLVERGLVREVAPPRGTLPDEGPYYATTPAFLDAFGLASPADLPPWPGPAASRQTALPLGEGGAGEARGESESVR